MWYGQFTRSRSVIKGPDCTVATSGELRENSNKSSSIMQGGEMHDKFEI